MSRGVQLPDLFDCLPPEEVQRELYHELETMPFSLFKASGKRAISQQRQPYGRLAQNQTRPSKLKESKRLCDGTPGPTRSISAIGGFDSGVIGLD
jgi:hypothetical protein